MDGKGHAVRETTLTVVGHVATEPQLRLTSTGTRVVSFRLGSTERRYDKALRGWRDGDTVFWTVTCWRNLGDNVLDSVSKGQQVVVFGRLRDGGYERDGVRRTVFEIEAYALGHDLARGVSRFTKASFGPGEREPVGEGIEARDPESIPDDDSLDDDTAGALPGGAGVTDAA